MSSARADALGRLVRAAWVLWAKEQPSAKHSWLVPWDKLDETDRDADRRIGVAIEVNTLRYAVEHLQVPDRPLERMWYEQELTYAAGWDAAVEELERMADEAAAREEG